MYVQGLVEREIVDMEDYIRVIQTGSSRRTVGETNMNETSSRSHSVLTLTIDQIQRKFCNGRPLNLDDAACPRKRSKIHLIDLAGNELGVINRIRKS